MKSIPTFDLSDVRLRHGALGGAALGAVVLLAVFYAVVSGAVERGTSRRADIPTRANVASAAPAPALAVPRQFRIARFDE